MLLFPVLQMPKTAKSRAKRAAADGSRDPTPEGRSPQCHSFSRGNYNSSAGPPGPGSGAPGRGACPGPGGIRPSSCLSRTASRPTPSRPAPHGPAAPAPLTSLAGQPRLRTADWRQGCRSAWGGARAWGGAAGAAGVRAGGKERRDCGLEAAGRARAEKAAIGAALGVSPRAAARKWGFGPGPRRGMGIRSAALIACV